MHVKIKIQGFVKVLYKSLKNFLYKNFCFDIKCTKVSYVKGRRVKVFSNKCRKFYFVFF